MRETRVFQSIKPGSLKHLFEDEELDESLDLTDDESESLGIAPRRKWIVNDRYDDLFD